MAASSRLPVAFVDLLRKLGINRAVGYYFLARCVSLVSVPVTIILVTTRFTPVLQGYYYTMASLVALQMIADFGFPVTLTQFVSHEWAFLRLDGKSVVGRSDAIARLASIVRLTFGWSAVMIAIVASGVFAAGYFVLATRGHDRSLDWLAPWIALSTAIAILLIGTTLRHLTEGINRVAESQRITVIGTLLSNVAAWIAILSGGGLYSLAVLQGTLGLTLIVMNIRETWPVLRLAWSIFDETVDIRADLWRQQFRIGASAIAGVLVSQSFVPFLFAERGPIEAGQAGLLLQANTFIMAMAVAWTLTSWSRMGQLWARKDHAGLRTLSTDILGRSLAMATTCALGAFVVIAAVKTASPHYGERFGSLLQAAILFLSTVVLQVQTVETTVVRYSKREPFLIVSLVSALLVLLTNAVTAHAGATYVFLAYLAVICCVVVPWTHAVYRKHLG